MFQFQILMQSKGTGTFKLKSGKNDQYEIVIDIPADAQPGEYPIRIVISDETGLRDIQYRTITIVK
jgi:hypothetical protein